MKTSLRLAAATVAALAIALPATGCTPGPPAVPRPTTPGAVEPTTTAPEQPGTPTTAPAATTRPAPAPSGRTTTAALPRCHTGDLTGHVEFLGPGAGQRYAALALTNRSAHTCRIYGYPGLELVDGNGGTLPTTTNRDTAVRPALLTVRTGQTVWAGLHWTAVPASDEGATCAPQPATLRVIPPDEYTQLTVSFPSGPLCQHGWISVTAFSATRPG